MPASAYFIDANLLLLLVVGSVSQAAISRHRRLRTRAFTPEDYRILLNLIDRVDRVLVTPNTLAETSNLLGQHGEPERTRFFARLQAIIEVTEEVVVASAEASNNSVFVRLGLTDCALLEVANADTPVVTVDFDLYHAALMMAPDSAINFNHLRLL